MAESTRYRWTVLVMLTLVYTFNFIDRQILVILQEPIKADLGLSDAQLGLLTGFSFALVYVTAGIPIAWLADRANRRNIVAASLAFWSLMTAMSGVLERGYTVQKFFPAEANGGPSALKAIGAPLPKAMFCPTGGVTPQNAMSYLSLKNTLCVGGSWVAPKALIEAGKWDDIEALARAACHLV